MERRKGKSGEEREKESALDRKWRGGRDRVDKRGKVKRVG